MPPDLTLGIDGGGTGCRARIRDGAGQVRGEAQGGPANIYQDFNGALATILITAQAAADKAGVALAELRAGLGLAGATGPEQCRRVLSAGLPFAGLRVESDGFTACLGAHGGQDGGIVIAGTGSAGLALVAGQRINMGGHGFMLGDQGSGAVMGRELLRCALLAHDGLMPASDLTRAVMAEFSDSPGRMIEWSRSAVSRDYARFAPQAFVAAQAGDAVGRAIVTQAATGLAAIARQLLMAGAPRLSLIGGLASAFLPYLPAAMTQALQPALADAVDGAIMMAQQPALAPA